MDAVNFVGFQMVTSKIRADRYMPSGNTTGRKAWSEAGIRVHPRMGKSNGEFQHIQGVGDFAQFPQEAFILVEALVGREQGHVLAKLRLRGQLTARHVNVFHRPLIGYAPAPSANYVYELL